MAYYLVVMLIVLQRHIHKDIFQVKKNRLTRRGKSNSTKRICNSNANIRNKAASKVVEPVQEVTSNINQFGLDYLTAR